MSGPQDRDEAAEREALQGVALWARQFTPTVSLAPPCTVLAEIGGCLRLFGGLSRLLELIRDGLAGLGYRAAIAIAPAAEGAHLLARAGLTRPVTDHAALREALAPLSIALLDCPRETREALLNIGARSLGECLLLPRDGFARRFGRELLGRLDRALGATPDPRPPFSPPARHRSALLLLFGGNAIFSIFHLLDSNLRHSHIWWSIGPVLNRILISPAQHQVHHSKAPQHWDRNFGEAFALWDWMFGTLYLTGREPEPLEFGNLGAEGQEHPTLWAVYTVPFVNCARLLRGYARRAFQRRERTPGSGFERE